MLEKVAMAWNQQKLSELEKDKSAKAAELEALRNPPPESPLKSPTHLARKSLCSKDVALDVAEI